MNAATSTNYGFTYDHETESIIPNPLYDAPAVATNTTAQHLSV